MNKQFQFPTYKQMYIGERRKLKRFRQYIRYRFYTLYCHKEIKQFEDYINQNPKFIPLFSSYYYRVNALLYTLAAYKFIAVNEVVTLFPDGFPPIANCVFVSFIVAFVSIIPC